MAEKAGNSQLLDSGQVLLAPEVTQIQFVYFDGTAIYDTWDMRERGNMPTAIEVRIWISPPAVEAETGPPAEPHMYSQTIDLPLAQATGQGASSSSSSSSSSSTDESSGTSSSSSSSNGLGTTQDSSQGFSQ